jgi:hypothetical protein
LRFRIAEEPTDPPEVSDWSWEGPDQESNEELEEEPEEESNGEQNQ